MLEAVDQGPAVSRVVHRRDVPEEEVDRPERHRDEGVGQNLELVEDLDREDRLQDRPGQTENDQQTGDVADDQVLDHVGDHQFLGQVAPGTEQHERGQEEAGSEADLPPERDRPSGPGESHRPVPVEDHRDGQGNQLQHRHQSRTELGERDCRQQIHGHSAYRGACPGHPRHRGSGLHALGWPAMNTGAGPNHFPAIGSYGFLSDCHTSALIAPDGSVEWLCAPRFDSPSVFGSILDRTRRTLPLRPG